MDYRYTQGIRIKAITAIIVMITAVVSVMATYLIQRFLRSKPPFLKS